MKTGKLKKLLKQQTADAMPSGEVKERIKGELFPLERKSPAKKSKPVSRRTISALSLSAAAVVIILSLSLILPNVVGLNRDDLHNKGNDNTIPDIPQVPVEPNVPTITDEGKLFAFSAATSGLVLLNTTDTLQSASVINGYLNNASNVLFNGNIGQYDSSSALSAIENRAAIFTSNDKINSGNNSGDLTEEQIAVINKYMNLVEGILVGNGVEFSQAESDIAEYTTLLVTVLHSFDGVESSVKLYYNQTILFQNSEETVSALSGIMKIGGEIFTVKGEKSVEDGEEELELIATAPDGRKVIMEQETELGEREFSYTVYGSDNKVIDSFSMELETERGETELQLNIVNAGTNLAVLFKSVEYNGKTVLNAHCIENGITTRFSVTITADENGNDYYLYTFESGGKTEMNRDGWFDFDDDD